VIRNSMKKSNSRKKTGKMFRTYKNLFMKRQITNQAPSQVRGVTKKASLTVKHRNIEPFKEAVSQKVSKVAIAPCIYLTETALPQALVISQTPNLDACHEIDNKILHQAQTRQQAFLLIDLLHYWHKGKLPVALKRQ
jgi:hypothetical protein